MLARVDALLADLAQDLGSKRRVVVATSGGPDSQALLWLASKAAERGLCTVVAAIGVDHGLRAGAGAELACAERLASQLQIPFAVRAVDASGAGNALARARRVRLRVLQDELARRRADVVLLGHTRDDAAETLLWHLLRGSAALAVAAMPRQRGHLVRPLLTVWRQEILALLQAYDISYATDPTNASLRRMRGRMRALVWPVLEDQFPGAKARLTEAFTQTRQEDRYLHEQAARWRRRASARYGGQPALRMSELQRAPHALWPRILRSFLLRHGGKPRGADVQALVSWVAHPRVERPGKPPRHYALMGLELGLSSAWVWICAPCERRVRGRAMQAPRAEAMSLPLLEGQWQACGPLRVRATHLPSLGATEEARRETLRRLGATEPRRAMTVAFARQRLHVALFLRPAVVSETLDAFGATGRVQVSKLVQEAKVPWAWRQAWPVVATAHEAVWVVGIRRGKQATINVLEDGPVTLLQAEWGRPGQQL